jgi:S-DNA-T family DNA segregation ATPase FtsK/SpoIIIE
VKTKKAQKRKYKVKKKKSLNYNHEVTGVLLLAFGVLIFMSFYFENSIGLFGVFIKESIIGLMGLPAYIVPPLIILLSFFVILKKDNRTVNIKAIYVTILLLLASSLIQTGLYAQKNYKNFTFINCIIEFYKDGRELKGGGILGGIISMPFFLIFQTLGTIIILSAFAVVITILLTNVSIANFIRKLKKLFLNMGANNARKRKELGEPAYDDISFQPDTMGNDGKPKLQIRPRPSVLNFELEKKSRDLRETVHSAGEGSGDTGNLSSLGEDESVQFIMKDMERRIKKQGTTSGSSIKKDISLHNQSTGKYQFPPLDLLNGDVEVNRNIRAYKSKAMESARKLEETLRSFGVEAKVVNICRGPAVTRYELQPSVGVKVSKIVNLADDIALNLASSGVRIEAPIPGKAAIGIEVPNKQISLVFLKDVINTPEFAGHHSKVAFAIGKDISGESVIADIAKMPHLLIAGSTGSGKSVCINTIIMSIIYKSRPDEIKLLLIDPKVVELSVYNGIPHLLVPVVTDPKKAAGALNWAVQEMINRYNLFAEKSVRDIDGYNAQVKKSNEGNLLPKIVIIIDELSDLMMAAPNEVEDAICRLAQMARAAGMHLVIATQRPSVDVITGVIKANIPSRISFSVSSQVDSRTILDMAGAEKLLGKGDMLYYPVGRQKPIRIQGAFISEKEVEKVVEFLKSSGYAEYDSDIIEEINSKNEPAEDDIEDKDELLPRAIDMVVDAGQASVSLIQRKFRVGYARAARIIDQMEARGIVGGFEGSKPRQVLITKQQWQELKMSDES